MFIVRPQRRRDRLCVLVLCAAGLAPLATCTAELRPLGRAGARTPRDGGDGPPRPGAEGSCVAETHLAERLPLDLLLLMDVSSSMAFPVRGSVTKWQMAHDALAAFLGDPNTPPLGVGLQFFPLPASCARDSDCWVDEVCRPRGARCLRDQAPCTALGQACPGGDPANRCEPLGRACYFDGAQSTSCDPGEYGKLAVPVADLAGNRTPLARTLAAQRPEQNIGTPLGPALLGALDHLRSHLANRRDRRAALVLTTDGEPDSACDPFPVSEIAALLEEARVGPPSIPTYVVAVVTPEELALARPTLDALVKAGGTGTPFVLDPGQNLTQKLQDALPCEFTVPRPSMQVLDHDRVNVRFKGASGEQAVVYVQSPDRCHPEAGGWYFDAPPNGAQAAPTGVTMPSRILACAATCRRFRGDVQAKLELRYGCKTLRL
jgi:hypothetical protein